MPDLSKLTTTDELLRILREEPDGLREAAIIEELHRRWMKLLARDFGSLGFAAHQDIAQNAWLRLQDRLLKGEEIRELWSFSDGVCRKAAYEWIRQEKGRRRRARGSDEAWKPPAPAGRTRGIEVPLDNVGLVDRRPSQEDMAILRQKIGQVVDRFERLGSLEALENVVRYGDGDDEDKEELAESLGCNRRTLRKIIQRARDKARELR